MSIVLELQPVIDCSIVHAWQHIRMPPVPNILIAFASPLSLHTWMKGNYGVVPSQLEGRISCQYQLVLGVLDFGVSQAEQSFQRENWLRQGTDCSYEQAKFGPIINTGI